MDSSPGLTADEVYEKYVMFGDDPFIVAVNACDPPVAFSAWDYAKARSVILANSKPA
jgi:hypothetical protein